MASASALANVVYNAALTWANPSLVTLEKQMQVLLFGENDQGASHAGKRVAQTPFHNTGLYNPGGTGAFPEPNRGVVELTGRAGGDMGTFRAPALRNMG